MGTKKITFEEWKESRTVLSACEGECCVAFYDMGWLLEAGNGYEVEVVDEKFARAWFKQFGKALGKKFLAGKTYATRSICDNDIGFTFKVIRRTNKFLTLEDSFGEVSRRKVFVYEGAERCKPQGDFSMAPVIKSDKP